MKLIVASSLNGVIGCNNDLPWKKQKADMTMFREKTMGHNVIMGRKTYDSIGTDLKGRHQIVLTRSCFIGQGRKYCSINTSVCTDVQEVIQLCKNTPTFVIGGSQVYNNFINYVNEIYLTKIHIECQGDAFFHVPSDFKEVDRLFLAADEENEFDSTFYRFIRN